MSRNTTHIFTSVSYTHLCSNSVSVTVWSSRIASFIRWEATCREEKSTSPAPISLSLIHILPVEQNQAAADGEADDGHEPHNGSHGKNGRNVSSSKQGGQRTGGGKMCIRDRNRSWAMTEFATSSSIAEPMKITRSFRRRE